MYSMNNGGILPSQCRDFMTQAYWEKFFKRIKKEGSETEYFEWYGEYQSFEHLFKLNIKNEDKILHIGCGKSLLAEQLQDNGICKDILNVDFEKKSLDHMAARSKIIRPEQGFQCFSLLSESFPLEPNTFDVILDKGTLDAIYPPSLKEEAIIMTFFSNLSKALKVGGRYILVSLLQDQIIKVILNYFASSQQWNITIHETVIEKSKLYPFYIVITKLQRDDEVEEQKQQQSSRIKLIMLNKTEKQMTAREIIKEVKHIQLQNHFITQVHKLRQGQSFTLDLWSSLNKTMPRYTLYIYDNDGSSVLLNKTCACFIIPQGKENSFIYGTPQGHKEIQKQAQMSRLVLARLNAGHQFESLKTVQKELSQAIDELTPKGCTNRPCPFMTDGDEIADKKVIFETEEFVVEEIVGDEDQIFRRVVHKSNLDQTQSQVRITYIDEKKAISNVNPKLQGLLEPKKGWVAGIDSSYLDFQAHISMIAGLCFLSDKLQNKSQNIEVLILGGGTGSLSQFLITHYENIKVTNIEISQDMVHIAKQLFDFNEDTRQIMLCCDALEYVEQTKNSHQYDCIIVDINSSNLAEVSPPPQQFLSDVFLQNLSSILRDDGLSLVMINLVDRYNTVKHLAWDLYYSIKCDDDLNEVLFLLNVKVTKTEDGKVCLNSEDLLKFASLISDGVTQLDSLKTKPWDPMLNITDYVGKIKLKHPKIQNQAFTISDVNVITDGEIQESGQRKEFYKQDLEKIQKKKNNRKKVNKNR